MKLFLFPGSEESSEVQGGLTGFPHPYTPKPAIAGGVEIGVQTNWLQSLSIFYCPTCSHSHSADILSMYYEWNKNKIKQNQK